MANPNAIRIEFGDITNSCFVIMPFSGSYQLMYERVIRPAVEVAGLQCIRGDEVFTTPQISHEIWKQIRAAQLVIAELTGRNPNVLYELGLAHAIGKPSLIITRNEEDVPFDLRALRYLFYDVGNPFWGDDLKSALIDMCRSITEQTSYDRVFEGISTIGNVAITDLEPTPPRIAQKHDLSGVWEGTALFENDDCTYHWNLHLIQKKGNLTGTSIISFEKLGEMNVVQQSMSGQHSFLRAFRTILLMYLLSYPFSE